MRTTLLAMIIALGIGALGLAGCAGSVANNSMPEWGRAAHEEANDKGP